MDAAIVLSRALAISNCGTDAISSPYKPPGALNDASLNRRVREMLASRVPASDLTVIQKCGQTWKRGLELTKVGLLYEADDLFRELGDLIDAAPVAEETRLLCRSFWSGAAAYLDYKLNRLDSAKSKIVTAIECDNRLANVFGYLVLHIRRLHLIENVIRIERRLNLESATQMAGDLLAYLAGCPNKLAFGGSSELRGLGLPTGNIRHRFASVSGDGSQSLACLDLKRTKRLFQDLGKFMDESFTREYVDEDALNWLSGKEKCLAQDVDGSLHDLSLLLSKHPVEVSSPKLWCAALLDTFVHCREEGFDVGSSLSQVSRLFEQYRFWTPPVRKYFERIQNAESF